MMRNDMLHPTRNSVPAEQRAELVAQLNAHLATLSDLHSQTKYAHWNVKGPNFIALHKLFDELAEPLEAGIDEIAERITALGGVARGTVRQAAAESPLEEFPDGVFGSSEVLRVLIDRYADAGWRVRAGIDAADELQDAGTADLLTGLSRTLDQSLYFLESHIEPSERIQPPAEAKLTAQSVAGAKKKTALSA
jgi:starvation-inducible DNA-binding protein